MSYLVKLINWKNSVEKKVYLITFFGFIWLSVFLYYLNYFDYSSLVVLLFLIFFAVLIFTCPESGLHLIIIGLMVYERWFGLLPINLFGLNLKLYPLDIIIIITILAQLWQLTENNLKNYKSDFRIFFIFWLIILIWLGLSIFWGGNQQLVFSAFKNYLIYPLVIFSLVVLNCQNLASWQRIFKTLLLTGLVLVGFIFYGLISGQGLWSDFTPLSTPGNRLLAATHAFYLIWPLLLLISLKSAKIKVFGRIDLLVIFIWIIGLIISLFRNLWLGFGVGLIFLFFLQKLEERGRFLEIFLKTLILAFIIIITLGWLTYAIHGDLDYFKPYLNSIRERVGVFNPNNLTDDSAKFRLAAWHKVGEILNNHWQLGIGFGQSLQFQLANNDYQLNVREIHNDYLALFLELGLVGSLGFVILIINILIKGYKINRQAASADQPYLNSALVFLVIFLILAALGTYFETNILHFFFWLSFGLIITYPKLIKQNV